MQARLWLTGFSLFCLALVWGGVSAAAQTTFDEFPEDAQSEFVRAETDPVADDRLDQALSALAGDESLQQTRPEWEPEARERRPRRDSNGPHPIARAIASFFNWIGQSLGYILMLIVVLAILAGLYMVFGESLTWRDKQKDKRDTPDDSHAPVTRPKPEMAQALLEDADALAAEGRFAEAVHLLLFRSNSDIQDQRQGVIDPSLTAREIGSLDILPNTIREALTPIISIVERSFFGGQPVNAGNWQDARKSYERFAFGEAWA